MKDEGRNGPTASRWRRAGMNGSKNYTSHNQPIIFMKNSVTLIATITAALFAAGCSSTYDKGPYLPEESRTPAYENLAPVVLLDPGVQHSVTTPAYVSRTLD